MAGGEALEADAVFEGGGAKGIGLVGALEVLEERGYRWRLVAGTSAGAIVASLVAAGYSAAELGSVIRRLDYRKFQDEGVLDRLGLPGKILSVLFEKGIYEGDFLLEWLTDRLAEKGVRTFADLPAPEGSLYRHRLQVIASDVTEGRLVVLPEGLPHYGEDPDAFPVAQAVRMSMSIPFFFEPAELKGRLFVDGGLLSNFPVWLFDRQGPTREQARPRIPTFGFKLIEPEEARPIDGGSVFSFTRQIIDTALEAHDRRHVETLDFLRTIGIPTMGVRTTDFDLSPERAEELYRSGRKAAEGFLSTWDMERYIDEARVPKTAVQTQKVSEWQERLRQRSSAMVGTRVYRP